MSTTQRVSETLARPARTGGQLGIAYAIMAAVQSFHHFTPEQFGALLGLLGLVVGAVQVAVENKLGVALLRTVAPKSTPIVDEETPVKKTRARKTAGFALIGLIGAILLVVGAIWLLVGAAHHNFDVWAAIIGAIGLVLLAFDGGYFGTRRRGL